MSSECIDIKCPACGSDSACEDHTKVIRGTGIVESSLTCYSCGLEVITNVVSARFMDLKTVNCERIMGGARKLKRLKKVHKNFNIDQIETYIP